MMMMIPPWLPAGENADPATDRYHWPRYLQNRSPRPANSTNPASRL